MSKSALNENKRRKGSIYAGFAFGIGVGFLVQMFFRGYDYRLIYVAVGSVIFGVVFSLEEFGDGKSRSIFDRIKRAIVAEVVGFPIGLILASLI